MSLRPLCLSLVLLAGCVPPAGDGSSPFAQAPSGSNPEVGLAQEDDVPSGVGGDPDGPETPAGDDDDDDDPGDGPEAWDYSTPDVPNGTVAIFDMECGLLTGKTVRTYVKMGAQWEEARVEGQEATPWPALMPCFGEGGKTLDRGTDGTLWLEAGALGHLAEPTTTPDSWLGEVAPLERSSEACDSALASMGMSWPVRFGLDLQAVVLPEE